MGVDQMVGRIEKWVRENENQWGGKSTYDPQILLKVIVYAYTQQVFSSHRLAKELRENVNHKWLNGMNRPDHRTINRFRGKVMQAVIDTVFNSVLKQLMEQGYVDLENNCVDGTKIEANANRYTFIQQKSTEKNKTKL